MNFYISDNDLDTLRQLAQKQQANGHGHISIPPAILLGLLDVYEDQELEKEDLELRVREEMDVQMRDLEDELNNALAENGALQEENESLASHIQTLTANLPKS